MLFQVEGVLGVQEFHVWQLAGNRIVLSAHITCKMREYMGIAAVVKDLFHNEGIHSTTIQPEFAEVSRGQGGFFDLKHNGHLLFESVAEASVCGASLDFFSSNHFRFFFPISCLVM